MSYKATLKSPCRFAPAMTRYPLGGGHHIVAWTDDNDGSLNTVKLSETIEGVINPSSIAAGSEGPLIGPSGLEQESSVGQPALAEFNGRLFIAWTGTDGAGHLNVMSSADGRRWDQTTKRMLDELSMAGPALATHAGHLFIAWTGVDGNGTLSLMESTDGLTFNLVARDFGAHSIDGSPSLTTGRTLTSPATEYLIIGWTERGTNKANFGYLFMDGQYAPEISGASAFPFAAPLGHQEISTAVPFVVSSAPIGGISAWWIDNAQRINKSTWDLSDPGLGGLWSLPQVFADTTDQPPAVVPGSFEIAWRGLDGGHSLNIAVAEPAPAGQVPNAGQMPLA